MSVEAWEQALDAALRGLGAAPEGTRAEELQGLAVEIRERLPRRRSLGLASLRERFAPVFAAHDEPALLREFVASPHYGAWREAPGADPGLPLEEAFARFALERRLLPPAELRTLRNRALVRALAVDPDPAFVVPDDVLGEPGRWILLQGTSLYAAVQGRVIEGTLPPLACALVRGEPLDLPQEALAPLVLRLQELKILPNPSLDRPTASGAS